MEIFTTGICVTWGCLFIVVDNKGNFCLLKFYMWDTVNFRTINDMCLFNKTIN